MGQSTKQAKNNMAGLIFHPTFLSSLPPSHLILHMEPGVWTRAGSPGGVGGGGGQSSLQGLLSHHVKLDKKVHQFKSTSA